MEALDAYELKVNPGKVKNVEEDKAEEDEEDEDEGAFLLPADVPADNEDSIDEEDEEEDEEHKEEHEEEPMTTLAELVLDVPIENIVEMPVESVFDPTDPKNSY